MTETEEPLDSPWDWVANHTHRYLETGGGADPEWPGLPILLLTTRGRRSGRLRRNPLIYGTDEDRYVIVASKGGEPKHPLWYLNLVEDPRVQLQVGTDCFDARARTATGEEKQRLWSTMTAIWPSYDDYQAKTDREIPLVVLARS